MSVYIPAIKGYIADVPRVHFKRCDNKIFYFDEITQASIQPNVQFQEVNAGWSNYPVAYLPGAGTMEVQMTSGQFNSDLFAMANAVNPETKAFRTYETDTFAVTATTKTVTLDEPGNYEASQIKDVIINGLEKGTDFTWTAGDDGKTVTLTDGVITKPLTLEVTYIVEHPDTDVIEIDNKSSAIGEATMKFPVYNNGDDCTDAAIKGYYVIKIYRCRVTTMPGFDGSYKSPSTFQLTWSAMDAKRNDGKDYICGYVPNKQATASNGTSGGETGGGENLGGGGN